MSEKLFCQNRNLNQFRWELFTFRITPSISRNQSFVMIVCGPTWSRSKVVGVAGWLRYKGECGGRRCWSPSLCCYRYRYASVFDSQYMPSRTLSQPRAGEKNMSRRSETNNECVWCYGVKVYVKDSSFNICKSTFANENKCKIDIGEVDQTLFVDYLVSCVGTSLFVRSCYLLALM